MEEVTITLPTAIAASLLEFINANMQVQGKEGANALLLIIKAFDTALVGATSAEGELGVEEDF
jgi:hypothetical protein